MALQEFDLDDIIPAPIPAVVAPEPVLTMAEQRQMAFDAAMAYGNGLTGSITSQYADAEVQSWTVQEAEARRVLAGETLDSTAMLPLLASDTGSTLEEYAASVIEKADAYRLIAVAAVKLRRQATGLLSPDLDTPEKLAAAVDALKVAAAEAKAALIDGPAPEPAVNQ